MRNKLLTIILMFCWTVCYGQYNFKTIDVNNGLSSNSIYNIFEDSKGYMWFATINGLNRYDGQRMRVFLPKKDDPYSISFSSIRCINEDKDGMIWIGGREGKIARYDPVTDLFKEYKLPHVDNSRNIAIWDLLIDELNTKWVITQNQIYMIEDQSDMINSFFAQNDTSVSLASGSDKMFSIVQDSQDVNIFWIGTLSKYLLKINRLNKSVENFVTPDETPFADIYQHSDGRIYATGYDGIVLSFDKLNKRWRSFQIPGEKNNTGTQITALSKNELLIATRLVGLIKFNINTNKMTRLQDYEGTQSRLGDPIIYALYTDLQNNIWIGTQNDGLRVITNSSRRFHHWILTQSFYDNHLPEFNYKEAFIHDFYEIDSASILFTIRGLPFIFKSDNDFSNVERMSINKEVDDFHFYDFNQVAGIFGIWSNHGFVRINLENSQLTLSKHFETFKQLEIASRVMDTMNDKYWFTVYAIDGCGSYDPVLDKITLYRDYVNKESFVNTLPKCYKGKVWFSNGNGLKSFDVESGQFHFIPNKNILEDLPYIGVHSIGFLNDSIMLICGLGIGILEFDLNNERLKKRYLLKDGLLSNQVMRFRFDNVGRLLYTSYAGLGIMNFEDGTHLRFNESNGLLNDYFGIGFHKVNNYFHLAGYGFFTRFNASDFPGNVPELIIRLESFNITNDTTIFNVNYKSEIELKPQQNFIKIDYSVNNLFSDEQLQFEYQLSNVDDTLKATSVFSLSYTNLLPGNYTFKIRPIVLGKKKAKFTILNISIAPYYWQTTWFKMIISFIIVIIVYGIYLARITLIKKEEATKRKLESKIKEIEMVALRSQMNPHFLFNSLNSIKSFIARQEPRNATNYLSKFAQLMRYILANSEYNLIPLAKELEAIQLYMDLERMRFDEKFDYDIDVDSNIMLESTEILPLILQPFIENAIWHGLLPKETKGSIRIAITKNSEMLLISISDNGIGRVASNKIQKDSVRKRKSYGIRITTDRIRHYSDRSSVVIKDVTDNKNEICGTEVLINLPI